MKDFADGWKGRPRARVGLMRSLLEAVEGGRLGDRYWISSEGHFERLYEWHQVVV